MGEFTSYWLYQKYVSTDSGQTYVPVYPAEYSVNGDGTMPLSAKSEYDEACGYVPPTPTAIYRWVDMDISTDYICDECPDEYTYKLALTDISGGTKNKFCDRYSFVSILDVKDLYPSLSSITDVVIGECVDEIDSSAFCEQNNHATSLTSVTLPSSIRTIGFSSFAGATALNRINFPYGLESIGKFAFELCHISSVTLPNTVTNVGNSAFRSNSSLTSVTLSSGMTVIKYDTFNNCDNLSNVTIPNGITEIEYAAFNGCSSLTSITLPNTLTTIGNSAFGATKFVSITIPSGVTSLGSNLFLPYEGEETLESVTVLATTPPTAGEYVMNGLKDNGVIYVPSASVNAYKTATNWSRYASRIQAIS